jgi:protein gp37
MMSGLLTTRPSQTTTIAWCDHTFNPWVGCTRVSPACDHCYAAVWARRYNYVEWGGPRRRTGKEKWREPLAFDGDARVAGVRMRIFCDSLADVFDNQVPDEWRVDLWSLIDQCRALDWLLLTKRPQNIAKMLPATWPWSHVWLGTTAENQREADRRLPILVDIPAAVHFVSVEPQLEPVDLSRYLGAGLDWVICGGESGRGCHPFDLDWGRSLRDQCAAARIPFFMKQLGGFPNQRERIEDLPLDLRIRNWPIVYGDCAG